MAFFTLQKFNQAEKLSGLGGPHGHHGGGGRWGGFRRGGGVIYSPGWIDPYWVQPSPYLVISTEEDDDDKDKKKKKKIKLGTSFPIYP